MSLEKELTPHYLVDLEFSNIKKIYIKQTDDRENIDRTNVNIYICVDKPCSVLKVYPNNQDKPIYVRSPFK